MYDFFNTRFFSPLKPKTYNLKPSDGFTLVELLIVVAIIGILSTVVFATISGTRPRARDAQRLVEVKEAQLAIIVLETSTSGGNISLGCATTPDRVKDCTGSVDFSGYSDPSASGDVPCISASTLGCDYALHSGTGGGSTITSSDYKICFYLEDPPSAGFTGGVAGVYKVDNGKAVASGC